MSKVAMAMAAHPDDIEFMMGGTLMLLGRAGYELHYMNVASGSCGTAELDRDEIVRIRTGESQRAAESIGAAWHPPIVDDLMVYYTPQAVARVCAVVRQVKPTILLLPSPQDYMEDHMNASRIGVTGAFCRNMKNFACDPPAETIDTQMALYHALPYGLCDQLRRPVYSDFYVDIGSVIDAKRDMLACHASQKEWLDASQGMNAYIDQMVDVLAEIGQMSRHFKYAEGWRRHSHVGYGPEDFDPLKDALGKKMVIDKDYVASLTRRP